MNLSGNPRTSLSTVKQPTTKDIKNTIDIIQQTWKNTNTIPYYTLTPRIFYFTRYKLDLLSKKILSKERKIWLENQHDYMLQRISNITGQECMSPKNVSIYIERLQLHFQKYGQYQTGFRKAMASSRHFNLGMILTAPTLLELTSLQARHVKTLRDDTSETTLERWLYSGKIVLMLETENIHSSRMPTYMDFESYTLDEVPLDKALFLRPLLGFGSLLWNTTLLDTTTLYLQNMSYDWFLSWLPCLPSQNLVVPDVPGIDYQARKWIIRAVTSNHSIVYETIVLLSNSFSTKIGDKVGMKFTLTENGFETPWGTTPLSISERKNALIALSIATKPTTLYKLFSIPETILYITSGTVLYKSEAYVDLCKSEMDKCLKESICKIVFVANKGEGKSTFINLILSTSLADSVFIEDSDDWGEWLTFLTRKTSLSDLVELDAHFSTADIFSTVADFYLLKKNNVRFSSYFNDSVKQVVSYYLSEHNSLNLPVTPNLLHNIITYVKPIAKHLLLQANNLNHLNQKMFEDGIKKMNAMRKNFLYLVFLHIAQDNVRRSPADIIFRFETGTDSLLNQALRAENKSYSDTTYLADLVLKIVYSDSTEFVIPRLNTSQVLKMFGVVPVLTDDLKLILYRDAQ